MIGCVAAVVASTGSTLAGTAATGTADDTFVLNTVFSAYSSISGSPTAAVGAM